MSKFSTWLNSLTEDTTPDASNDFVVTYDASAATAKKVKPSNLPASSSGIGVSGWVSDANTWSYSSADDPTGVISVNADMTGIIGVGMRIKLTQTTVKYFIVTAVGNFGGGATLITVYGGTDYTLANAAITSPNYSVVKAPLGFPATPAKWTVQVTDTSSRTQDSPVQNTWYNLGSISISIPIGVWRVRYEVCAAIGVSGSRTDWSVSTTLSTANNSESDAQFSTRSYTTAASAVAYFEYTVYREKFLTLASKTAYYFNTRTITANGATIYNNNDATPLIIEAVCAYL